MPPAIPSNNAIISILEICFISLKINKPIKTGKIIPLAIKIGWITIIGARSKAL